MTFDWLDILTTILGLIYIWLEYRASIALWFFGIIMPALDVYLYWTHGLYGDAGMAVYYTLAAFYGLFVWRFKITQKAKQDFSLQERPKANDSLQERPKADKPITRMSGQKYLPVTLFFLVAWAATYYVLITYTNSTVPLLDAFTNALSFVGLWALARKYLEQWFFWIIVDAVCCYLYIGKGIPFKAALYGLYVVIAVLGYFKWKRMMVIHN